MSKEADEVDQAEMVIYRFEREIDVPARVKGGKVEKAVELIEEGWSADHAKLVYLISRYGKCAESKNENESWIRETPLNVLIYEGTVSGLFQFDYAPASTIISTGKVSRRIWMNISQEGKAALDDIVQKTLINGLKLSTADYRPVKAFQVSKKGLDFLKQMPEKYKRQVDKVYLVPINKDSNSGRMEMIQVRFVDSTDDENPFFTLYGTQGDYIKQSKVTETEDVSYVSSPYLPWCIRNPRNAKQLSSNAHRWKECASGKSTIEDELDVVIELSRVQCIIGEWIPFGTNSICALNDRLGALDRCQGGMYTSSVDKQPTGTVFTCSTGLTKVGVLDFDFVNFINFEAEISYPEKEGIVQIESFGMHFNVDGTILYGFKIEAILDRDEEHVSLDHLSRLLVDIHQDSSQIMKDLVSSYQQDLIDLVYMGDSKNRGKFNMLLAEGIDPFLRCDLYLDKDAHENELKQVLGDIFSSHDLGEHGVFIRGRNGVLLCGHDYEEYESHLVSFCSLCTREMFIRAFFVRIFVVDQALIELRQQVLDYDKDPTELAVNKIRQKLAAASKSVSLFEEVYLFLQESMDTFSTPESKGSDLEKVLDLSKMKNDAIGQISDLSKLIKALQNNFSNIESMAEVMNSKSLAMLYKTVENQTKYLVDKSEKKTYISKTLEVIQLVLAGSFLFHLIDCFAAGSLNIKPPDYVVQVFQKGLTDVAGLWFSLNVIIVIIFITFVMRYMNNLYEKKYLNILHFTCATNLKIKLPELMTFLHRKNVIAANATLEKGIKKQTFSWDEKDKNLWGDGHGDCPHIEILCDLQSGFILTVKFIINKERTKLKEKSLLDIFIMDIKRNFALAEGYNGIETILEERRKNVLRDKEKG
eukprot:g708.t1